MAPIKETTSSDAHRVQRRPAEPAPSARMSLPVHLYDYLEAAHSGTFTPKPVKSLGEAPLTVRCRGKASCMTSSSSLWCYILSPIFSRVARRVEAADTGKDAEEAVRTRVDAARTDVDSGLGVHLTMSPVSGLVAPQYHKI